MKRLLTLVLLLLAVAAFAETDPFMGLPLTGCTEEMILDSFEEKELLPTVVDREGEYRGELCLNNESREVAVYVYDGNLKLIECFWGIDSPSAAQVEEITESRVDLVGLFTSYFEQEPTVLAEELEGWLIHQWETTGLSLQMKSKAGSEYAAVSVDVRITP
ncbi:hypothetical protein K8R78_00090 [bacterium]|nr:hypothetical protein [bacterium]